MRIVALEYAIAGACDGGAYLARVNSIGDLARAIADCAGLHDGNERPPGADAEEWQESMAKEFEAEAAAVASAVWRNPAADYASPLPWRPGFVIRCWRVSPREARQWEGEAG